MIKAYFISYYVVNSIFVHFILLLRSILRQICTVLDDNSFFTLFHGLSIGASVKMEPGVEAEATVKEEEKEERKEKDEKKEKDMIKKEEKDREREKEKERERPTRSSGSSSSVIKEEKEKPGCSSQPEESAGERLSMVGGSKRKEIEQLKIVRAELK